MMHLLADETAAYGGGLGGAICILRCNQRIILNPLKIYLKVATHATVKLNILHA